jgi:hypothetical protein
MPDRSTGTLFCASTRTWRASLGESCSIGVPPLALGASRNFLMSAATEAFTIDAGMFYPFAEGGGVGCIRGAGHATRLPITPLLPLGAMAGRCVLVEDDEAIVSDWVLFFEASGADVIGPRGERGAIGLIADPERLLAAVLDPNLQGEMAYWWTCSSRAHRG